MAMAPCRMRKIPSIPPGERSLEPGKEIAPVGLEDIVPHRTRRRRLIDHAGNDRPTEFPRGLQEAVHRRVIATQTQNGFAAEDLKFFQFRGAVHERIGFVIEAGNEKALIL